MIIENEHNIIYISEKPSKNKINFPKNYKMFKSENTKQNSKFTLQICPSYDSTDFTLNCYFTQACPASEAECYKCDKTGHFAKCCRGKRQKSGHNNKYTTASSFTNSGP